MDDDRPKELTLGQFTASFVPAGLLLTGALLWPEMSRELDLNRTRYTIWVTTFLLIPALALYPFRSISPVIGNTAHLYWSCAYVAYVIHATWAVFIIFDGVADTFRQQGTLIASVNFFLTGLWTLDVLVLWLVRSPGRPLIWFRLATRGFTFVVFAGTLLFLREGMVRWLGAIFTAVVLGAAVVRLLTAKRGPAAAPA